MAQAPSPPAGTSTPSSKTLFLSPWDLSSDRPKNCICQPPVESCILESAMLRARFAASLRSLSAVVILALFLTLPAHVRPAAEPDLTGASGKYTYWIEMTSLSVEQEGGIPQGAPITPMPDRSYKIYIPFFAIEEGKFEIPLKAWQRDLGEGTFLSPEKVYLDRDLTIEGDRIDLVRGFQKTGLNAPANEAHDFSHTVYGGGFSTGLFKVEFKVVREPSRLATQMEADLAYFDRKLIGLYVPESEDSAGPLGLIATLGQRAVSFLIDMVFVVDRVIQKSKSVITPDYLERISQPSSVFYKDFLEYELGSLTEDQLIRRLPHVAMIGDSLVKNMYVASALSMFWRVRTEHQGNWFLDTDKSPDSIHSIYERLEEFTPLVAVEYSGSGANVDSGESGDTFFQMLSKTRNFSQQAYQILY